MSTIDVTHFTRKAAADLVPVVAAKIDEAGGPDSVTYDDIRTVADEFAGDAVRPVAEMMNGLWDGMLNDEYVQIAREIATDALAALKTLGYADEHNHECGWGRAVRHEGIPARLDGGCDPDHPDACLACREADAVGNLENVASEGPTPLKVKPAAAGYGEALMSVIDSFAMADKLDFETAVIALEGILSADTFPATEVVKAIQERRSVVVDD